MNETIDKLIRIADALDSTGFKKEANMIDNLIRKTADNNNVIHDFVADLIMAFKDTAAKQNIFPTINEKSLPEILQVISDTLEKKAYNAGVSGLEILKQLENPVRQIVDGILALEDDIPKVLKDISESKDELEKKSLESEYQSIRMQLGNLRKRVDELKNGRRTQDIQQYKELQDYAKSRGREV
jgi:FtsZ-binding cell division protein ZapB